MKRILMTMVLLITVLSLVFGSSVALAAKPQHAGKNGMDVIAKSNGFPSGPHFNLNIHGKDPLTFEIPDPPYGSSVHVPEYCPAVGGEATEHIRYESGKKASVDVLTVTDPVTEEFDGSPAVVQLPYEVEGYYVFARILGGPQKGKNDPKGQDRSNIILKPNKLVDDPDYQPQNFTDLDDGDTIGLITKDSVYYSGEEAFYRFDDPDAKGKGKSLARDITHLFLYTGWVIHPDLDLNDDGVIDDADVPSDAWDVASAYDAISMAGNGDGFIQIDEWLAYQASLPDPLAVYFAQSWIFNIADLVWTDQGLVNDGCKLLQLRFYPVSTTEYTAPGYIIVDKVTNPSGDPQSFEFDASYYGSSFTLTDGDLPNLSGPLAAGTYSVAEINIPSGWDLMSAVCSDGSDPSAIDLEPGETVKATFTNAKQGVNLSINKTDGLAEATVGQEITYTISVGNFGTIEATGVIVTDTLPSEVTFVSATAGIGTVSFDSPTNTVAWVVGNLAATGTYDYSLTIIVTAGSVTDPDPATNTAIVSCNEADIDPATNTAIDETVIVEST